MEWIEMTKKLWQPSPPMPRWYSWISWIMPVIGIVLLFLWWQSVLPEKNFGFLGMLYVGIVQLIAVPLMWKKTPEPYRLWVIGFLLVMATTLLFLATAGAVK